MQKGQAIYKITKTIREIRGCTRRRKRGYMGVQRLYKGVEGICTVEGYGDRWKYKDDTRDEIRWDMLNGTGIVNMEIQGGYQ